MNFRLMLDFLTDKLNITIGFICNSFILSLYYYLFFKQKTEIIFPLLMSFFVYIIVLALEWNKYKALHNSIETRNRNGSFQLEPKSIEHKKLVDMINNIDKNNLNKVNNIIISHQQELRFISQWVHNMKTPVSVIDLAIQQSGEAILKDILKVVEEENLKIHSNLNHLLNMIRLEEFSADYVPETIDLLKSVKKVINNKKNQFVFNNVYPKIICDLTEAPILSDKKWNEVILEQIISNAIKYSLAHDKSKFISFIIEKEKNYTILTIKDEGAGIPLYDIDRVFEPFFTGENGRNFKSASGIGLYLCKMISDKLGHKISISSTVGLGTEVKISYLSKL